MRILVTISRDWDNYLEILEVVDDIIQHSPDHTFVHGASQMDWFVAGVAYALGAKLEAHPAEWAKHGSRAGPIRNSNMVDLGADLCLAFIKNKSRGATDTADKAEAAGIPTRRYTA